MRLLVPVPQQERGNVNRWRAILQFMLFRTARPFVRFLVCTSGVLLLGAIGVAGAYTFVDSPNQLPASHFSTG